MSQIAAKIIATKGIPYGCSAAFCLVPGEEFQERASIIALRVDGCAAIGAEVCEKFLNGRIDVRSGVWEPLLLRGTH